MAKGLRLLATGIIAGMLLLILGSSTALALVDSVLVSDLTVKADSTDTVWVYLENVQTVKGIDVPLIIREITVGSFMKGLALVTDIPGSRIVTTMLEVKVGNLYEGPDGNCKGNNPGGFHFGSDTVDFISPDAVYFARATFFSPDLSPGSDFAGTGTGIPSFGIELTANSVPGTFEIDTTCTDPANHLGYVARSDGGRIKAGFSKGTVTITGASAVNDISAGAGVPEQYSLGQNQPNPFNGSTVIEFTNRRDGHVRLEVFNILGQNVVTLIDKYMNLGTYAVDWDSRDRNGNNVSSGMYFYRLSSGEFSDVKKMVLLK